MPSRAEEIVRALREAGVQTVFGIPSVHNIALYEALRHARSIRHIVCRHEAAATHMADGYARASGTVGIIISSTGPGAGLTLSALQEAWGSCSPVVMITTNIDAAKIGKGLGALHELEEQTALFRTVTKATIAVRDGDDCYRLAKSAIATALRGRPGPVCLEVPTDLLAADSFSHLPRAEENELPFPVWGETPSLPPRIDEAVAMLRRARQPLIIAGTDAVRARLGPEITALAEALCAPVITSTPGKGIVAEDHPLAFGNAARRLVVKEIVPACDVALAIGTRLREVDAKRRGLVLPEQLIHVDWDERWVGRNFPTPLPLIGDIRLIAQELCRHFAGEPYSGPRQERVAAWRHQAEAEMRALRQELVEIRYLEAIRHLLPRDSALVIDNTQLGYWAEYFYPSYQPHGLVAAKGSALLGFSFPGAIGVKLAWPEKAVVGLIGDGGFLYTAQELATCVRHGIGFPLIVVNDNAYGVIGYLQRTAYQAEYEARLTNPDFVAFAGSFGVAATRVRSPEELEQALGHALQSGQMHLIELQVEIAAPPFGRY
ncbi:MAG: thiamine pyrophosphate-binding protein [Candidatus Binatia bacterium]|nr:thiamine pyrophosphate-binding protein [Candidatus Binatia bacterium]